MGESFCPADADYAVELRIDFVYCRLEFDGYKAVVE
jgi:hypothetical protein